MLPFHLTPPPDRPLSVLVLGAHPDDIEIGAGGMLLTLAEGQPGLQARYVVLTGTADRQMEARNAANAFLPAADVTIELHDLPDGQATRGLGPGKRGTGEHRPFLLARPHHRAFK